MLFCEISFMINGQVSGLDNYDNGNEETFCSIEGRQLLLEETGGLDFDDEIQNTIDLVYDLDDFVDEDLLDLQEAIEEARKATSNMEDRAKDIDINDWQSLLIIIPFVILSTLMLVGMILASVVTTMAGIHLS